LELGAFLLNEPIIALLLRLRMVSGVIYPKMAVIQLFYHRVIKPELMNELSNPHQFASVLGGTFKADIILVGAVREPLLHLTFYIFRRVVESSREKD
jgi:hypothetical protein